MSYSFLKRASFYYLGTLLNFVLYVVWYVVDKESVLVPIFLYTTLLFLLSAVFLSRISIFKMFKKRAFKTASGAILSAIIVLFILIIVNYIAGKHNSRFDLTKNKINTLSQQSVQLVKSLRDSIEFIIFVKDGPDAKYIASFLDRYRFINKEKIHYKVVDPNKNPIEARSYNVSSYGTIVLKYKTKHLLITKLDEESITNAIIKLSKADTKYIYFTIGHGEASLNDDSGLGIKSLKEAINSQAYKVKELNILRDGIPKNASIIVLVEPKKALLPKELEFLKNYYLSGGNLLILKGPELTKNLHKIIYSLNKLLAPTGIKLRNDFVIETQNNLVSVSMGLSNAMPIAGAYSQTHKITKDFKDITFFPIAQSLDIKTADKFKQEQLIESTASAVGLINPKSGKIDLAKTPHNPGPLSLAVIAEATDKTKNSRVLVFSSSLFVNNQYIQLASNSDLILNTISYLANDSDLIAIRPKKEDFAQFKLKTPWLPVLYIYALPPIILIFGIAFWIKRKRT